ncbi:family 78 glycoside hydrolase catalytic domain [Microlunatus soli]|uniref:alpha-L-rhamnosidase n=1 Tax=Microlunatus soli TaxID=630515 RepID=A0A1H1ZRA2_9ACTN|nr:family 78 glycoside hydrolase catalytic domain [Microlunatus soli]SDT36325.1 alpha-L-rhamnosidase [Microlunatus soli]
MTDTRPRPGTRPDADVVQDLAGADWITHPDWAGPEPGWATPTLRTMINCDQPPVRAQLTIVGLGVWVAHLNGRPVSADVLEPGSSEFTRRVAARRYPVGELITAGRNEFVLQLGEGSAHVRRAPNRYTKLVGRRVAPRARVSIVLDFADGSSRRIVSGTDWQARLGPTALSHWYGGEDYDAGLEPAGWLTSQGSADDGWDTAVVVGDAGTDPQPWTRRTPPTRVQELFEPAARWSVGEVEVVDFGRNLAGREVIRLDPGIPAGTRIELRPAEYLAADGTVDQHSTGSPIVDTYTTADPPHPSGAAPREPVSWRPQFGYHGFRYLQIQAFGPDGAPTPTEGVAVQAERLMTDDRPVGSFGCSDPTLSGIHTMVRNAIQSNLYSVPTDCPHREKLGWLEQLHLVIDPLTRSFDVADHLADMITHMADAQTADGLIPSITPELVVFDHPTHIGDDHGFRDDVNWGSAIWQLPWALYRTYGDLAPARAAWEPGLAYLRYLQGIAGDGLLDHGLADWITLDDSTPRVLVANYGLISMLDVGVRLAEVLGHEDERRRLAETAGRLRRLLADDQIRETDGGPRIGSGSQASLALMIDLGGVLSATQQQHAEQELVELLHRGGGRITVGEIGLPALVRVLTRLGEHELIRTMVSRTDVPGYGQMLAAGYTALAEHWTGAASRKSANHFMLGYIDRWLTGSIGGLEQAPGDVGWRRAVVAIAPLAGLDRAQHDYDGPSGRWALEWQRDGDTVRLRITVPPGAEAEIVTPAGFRDAAADRHRWTVGPGDQVIDFVEIVTA